MSKYSRTSVSRILNSLGNQQSTRSRPRPAQFFCNGVLGPFSAAFDADATALLTVLDLTSDVRIRFVHVWASHDSASSQTITLNAGLYALASAGDPLNSVHTSSWERVVKIKNKPTGTIAGSPTAFRTFVLDFGRDILLPASAVHCLVVQSNNSNTIIATSSGENFDGGRLTARASGGNDIPESFSYKTPGAVLLGNLTTLYFRGFSEQAFACIPVRGLYY